MDAARCISLSLFLAITLFHFGVRRSGSARGWSAGRAGDRIDVPGEVSCFPSVLRWLRDDEAGVFDASPRSIAKQGRAPRNFARTSAFRCRLSRLDLSTALVPGMSEVCSQEAQQRECRGSDVIETQEQQYLQGSRALTRGTHLTQSPTALLRVGHTLRTISYVPDLTSDGNRARTDMELHGKEDPPPTTG